MKELFIEREMKLHRDFRKYSTPLMVQLLLRIGSEKDKIKGVGKLFQYFTTHPENAPHLHRR